METSSIVVLIIVAIVAVLVWREQGSKKPVSKPAPVADKNNNGIVSKAELGKLTKVQLFEFAEKKSLKVKKSGNKASVINEIHTQLK